MERRRRRVYVRESAGPSHARQDGAHESGIDSVVHEPADHDGDVLFDQMVMVMVVVVV